MKLEVKIVLLPNGKLPEKSGNFFDLSVRESIVNPTELYDNPCKPILLPLGVKMTLPKWYGAQLKVRSSTYKRYGLIQTNGVGEIEWDFSEEWKLPVMWLNANCEMELKEGDKIAQFQIYLLPEAPWYIKLRHLFVTGFKFEQYAYLTTSRKGFGSTGR